jgi:hypothetical protein
MTSDASDLPQPPDPRRRRWTVVAIVVGVAMVGSIAFFAWPRAVCSDDERSALLAVPGFEDASPPVVDSGPETQPSTAGCAVSYAADASADEVARHYADHLAALGWSPQLGGWIQHIAGDPPRIFIGSDHANPVTHPEWKDVHYFVALTLEHGHVQVDVVTRRYVVKLF